MLIELLAMLIAIAAFMFLATRLFTSTMRLNGQAAAVHTNTARFDAALRALRADVWGADSLSASKNTLTIGSLQWTIDPSGTFIRTQQNKQQRWPTSIANITLTARATQVVVTVPDTQQSRGAQIHLVSQLQLGRSLAP